MTANELADEIEDYEYEIGVKFSKTIGTMLRQQAQEIEELKEALQDCTCQGGHSEAYLKAKGKL
jgi:hypothetical protein